MTAHVGFGHAFERRPRLGAVDDAGREIIKTRGHFPNDEAATKLI